MAKHAGGRPTLYNQEIAKRICDLVATHTCGIDVLCATYKDLPDPSTILDWRWKHDEFSRDYARSKMNQAELMAEDLNKTCEVPTFIDSDGIERVDTGRVALQRLKADAIKWQATKLAPKIYGDKVTQETTVTIKHEDALKELE